MHCKHCNYSTNDKSNWKRHINSKKHIGIINNNLPIDVESVNNIIKNNNLTNELIFDKTKYELMKQTDDLLLNEKNKQIEDKDKQIDYLKNIIETMKNTNNTTGNIADKSISTLNYVITNFKKAPQLHQLEYDQAKEILESEFDKVKKVIEFNDNKQLKKEKKVTNSDTESEEPPDLTQEEKEKMYVEKLLHLHEQKQIVQHIKEIITPLYKTDDPKKQSIWNTDAQRLNYLIRDIVGKQLDWISDKKGKKLINYVIQPITKLMAEMVEKYKNEQFKITQQHEISLEALNKANYRHKISVNVIESLLSKNINNDVCSELCPDFHLDKHCVGKYSKTKKIKIKY